MTDNRVETKRATGKQIEIEVTSTWVEKKNKEYIAKQTRYFNSADDILDKSF